ncbi:MAG: hypothetical protein K2O95_07180 [Clostridia bacterium]|nr:hypothetical protein [Clostridia bacterium]
MLSFIDLLYSKFLYLLSDWKLEYFIVFFTVFPVVVLVLQGAIYASKHRYLSGKIRLDRFLKKNAFITPRNFFFFNKKVVKVFPKRVRKQVDHIADRRLSLENIPSVFKSDGAFCKTSVVKAGYFIHIVSMGVIMSINGFDLAHIAFCAIGMSIVWIAVAVVDMLVALLIRSVDKRSKKKFIFALERNMAFENQEIDLTLPKKRKQKEDSVSELAKSIESFLESKPDKGIAGVVLKSLYSASYSGAMTTQSAIKLKNAMNDLKKYVG